MPLPIISPVTDDPDRTGVSTDERETPVWVEIDLATGEVTTPEPTDFERGLLAAPPPPLQLPARPRMHSPTHEADVPAEPLGATRDDAAMDAIPSDHGTAVYRTYDFPWSAVVKLNVGCSASVVSPFHLLTAAHCIYKYRTGYIGEDVIAFPGHTEVVPPGDRYDHPFGRAVATTAGFWAYNPSKGVTGQESVNSSWDQAILTLDRSIGLRTGYFSYDNDYTSSYNYAGYSGETHDGNIMYKGFGSATFDDCNLFGYNCGKAVISAPNLKGNSGGPIWAFRGSSRIQEAIISGTNEARTIVYGARLWTSVYDAVRSRISLEITDESLGPRPRPELIEYVKESNHKDLLTNTVAPGGAVTVRWNVYNVGFAHTGRMTVRFYLSRDRTIRSTDTLIGTVTLPGLGPNVWFPGRDAFTIPGEQPAGTYYVGYTMGGAVAEYTVEDNVVLIDERLVVTAAPDLVVPSLTVPSRSGAGEPFDIFATVRNSGNGTAPPTTVRFEHREYAGLRDPFAWRTTGRTTSIASLAASGSTTANGILTAPQQVGEYEYRACVNAVNGERDDTNNCSTAHRVTVVASSTDRATLVALYNATGGPNWRTKTNWLSNQPISTWHGVTTDADGRVTELRLFTNRLAGPIPAAIGSLVNLEILDFSTNRLTGPIPAAIGSLTGLRILLLQYNQLSGSIPAAVQGLVNLEHLLIDHNQLTGAIPSQLGSLSRLKELQLWDNQLSGSIPGQLGDLRNLESLDLRKNRLSGDIPAELGNLTNIEEFYLVDNQLTGGIPASFGRLTNVLYMFLNGNRLSGPIPTELGNIASELFLRLDSDTGLCLPPDFPLDTPFGRAVQQNIYGRIPVCGGGGAFTDDPIVAGETPVRAVHFTELRGRIDALRTAHGLGRFPWTDPSLAAGVTRVRGVHMSELRTALGQVYDAASRTIGFGTEPVQAGWEIRAAHINELRRAVEALVTVAGLMITSNGGGERATITVPENQTAVTTVTASGGTPPYEFQWSSSQTAPDGRQFTMNNATGALAFVTAPDYENPTDSDRDNNYVLNVRVQDASQPSQLDRQVITVTVTR